MFCQICNDLKRAVPNGVVPEGIHPMGTYFQCLCEHGGEVRYARMNVFVNRKKPHIEYHLKYKEYKEAMKTLQELQEKHGPEHGDDLLPNIGKKKLTELFSAIRGNTKALPQMIKDIEASLTVVAAEKARQAAFQRFYHHPEHTLVGKLALWCLLRPFA